jgi:two-component system chemotaxis response regulator CheB
MYSVLIVDDSALMRKVLKDMINNIDEFTVVNTAVDAFDAREKIKQYEPDLVTIDINMPKMSGVAFLRNLMKLHPMPAVVISGEGARGSEVFDDGAVGFIPKPESNESMDSFQERIKDSLLNLTFLLKRYTKKKPKAQIKSTTNHIIEKKLHPDSLLDKKPALRGGKKIIAIGSSTGGVESLLKVFETLPAGLPPIVMTQHIPYGFSNSFAQRLHKSSHTNITVKEAEDGDICEISCAYLAPGNKHMIIENTRDGKYRIRLDDGPKISRHKPSVNILFRSINNSAGSSAMGIIMTGMGDDGALCLKEMYDNGAYTVAQDEKSCVVFGMPAKAIEAMAARRIISLDKISSEMVKYSNK